MKKFFKITLAIMLIACFALMSTACRINKDWMDVEEKLIDNRYDVDCLISETSISNVLTSMNLEILTEDVECVISAEKGYKFIIIFFCYEKYAAKDIEYELEKSVREIAKEKGVSSDDIKYGRDGKVAYLGHKDAVRAAK